MNGVLNTWTRETRESSEAQLQHAHEQIKLLTDSQHTPQQSALDTAPTPQAADQPAKRVPWWRRLLNR